MMRLPRSGLTLVAVFAAFIATWGCGGKTDTGPSGESPQDGFRQGGPPGGGGPGGGGSPIRQIMRKFDDRAPNSLGKNIENGLRTDPPAWEALQPQSAEYAQLAADLTKLDPPKGDKGSWTKLTSAFAASATALDKSAQAKDVNAARAAETKLRGSCMDCHQAHRGGPGGGFGPPGGRGGPRGRGGPPPGT